MRLFAGLSRLMKLESLCLSHNFLTHEELGESCAFSSLIALKKLDLSRNLLRQIPDIISSMSKLVVKNVYINLKISWA